MAKIKTVSSPFLLKLSEYVIPTIISLAIISSFVLVYVTMNKTLNTAGTPTPTPVPTVVDADPFKITTTKSGKGEGAKNGDKVTVNYIGSLKATGKVFDDSYTSKKPLEFTVGDPNSVIAGFMQGVIGMKVGEKRTVQIPASLGYGATDYMTIPGNSTLIFQIEMVKITKK